MTHNFSFRHSLAALLLLLPTGIAQEDESGSSYEEFPLERELVIGRFTPRHVHPGELMAAISGFFGDKVRVRLDPSGDSSARFQGFAERPRFRGVGETLLIFDLPAKVEFLLDHLKTMDKAPEGTPPGQPMQGSEPGLFEYQPRYVSIDAMEQALKPFERVLSSRSQSNEHGKVQTIVTKNQTFVHEENMVLIRDTRERLDQLQTFLERFDIPTPQIEIEAFILRRPEPGSAPEELPAELAAGLNPLLQEQVLTRGPSALLRTSVRSHRTVSINLQGAWNWDLSLHPAAFDPEAAALSLDECKLLRSNHNGGGARLMFSTQTTLNAGQYTVIGGGSEEAIYLVLRFRRVDGSPR